jgi:hypothetical protein
LEKPEASILTSALKMETVGSSTMLLLIYQITRCHILELCNLNSHCHENLTTQMNMVIVRFKVVTAGTIKTAVFTCPDDGGSTGL